MFRISNLKIGTRMFLGFGFVASQLFVGAALGLWCMQTVNLAQQEVRLESRISHEAAEIETNLGDVYINLWNFISHDDVEERKIHAAAAEQARTDYQKRLELLRTADLPPRARELMAEVSARLTAAAAVNEQAMTLARQGENAKAVELFLKQGEDLRVKVDESVMAVTTELEQHLQSYVEKSEALVRRMRGIMYGGTILGVLIAFGMAFAITRSVTGPLGTSVELVGRVSQGDVSADVPDRLRDRGDEVGAVARSLQEMIESLRRVLRDIAGGVETLATSATDLSAASGQTSGSARGVSDKATTVASAAEEASANTSSVASSMEQATTNLSSVASATEQMSATVGEIAANSEKARSISEQANTQAQTISSLMQQLGEAAREIGKVTETITDISSQTNLLALNATIEAARAGAAGKGFAVVANEIKELARQTASATEDIKSKIAGVQSSAGGAIADIEKIAGIIKEVGHIVASIAAAIEEQAAVTKDVAANIAQASAGVKDANERVAQTATVSRSIARDIAGVNVAMTEIRQGGETVESSAASLSQLADQLKLTMSHFHV